ncbi:Cupredoxin [Mycotypha africana]|uniref:Cupredoxin n=1 Tax=Mycotypha africana TaxID=64632 RepID=UPI0023005247|nr:Cupredoxin [Mycotypha africana]KAI8981945.1 Cupredoxin [Mycotypha africana]
MRAFSYILLGLLALTTIHAKRVVYDMNVTYIENVNPDGLKARRVIGINNQWPIPPVVVDYGDTLVMNVHNSLDNPTTLHAHGQFQNGTNWMDGPSGVTQCPIPPNYDFTYEFNITQNGTYWMHSHYGSQYMDGFRMPFIINNPEEPYKYDEDVTITLSDWYHDESEVGLATFLSVYNPTGAEPVPQSALINDNRNTSFEFVPGKTYRLRIINMASFATFYFDIDGHDMDIIECDGVYTERTTVQSLFLTTAQRFSVLVTAKNSTGFNYYMHADMDTVMFDTIPEDLNPNATAPIYYDRKHNNFAPERHIGMASTFDEQVDVIPLEKEAAAPYDHQINLTIDFQVTNDGINRGMFNYIPFIAPKVPSLHTLFSTGEYAMSEEVYGPLSRAFVLKHNDMVEIVLNNLDANNHPFHLHGHVFQMVGRGEGVYDGNTSNVEWFNDNPPRRDTLRVADGGFSIIRFRADNPGVWIFHCHIDWHLESGLAALMIEAPDVVQNTMKLPQAFMDVCEAGNNPATGNAAGKEGLDLKGAPSGIGMPYDGFTAKGKGAMAACIICALIGMASIIWYAFNDPVNTARERMGRPPSRG